MGRPAKASDDKKTPVKKRDEIKNPYISTVNRTPTRQFVSPDSAKVPPSPDTDECPPGKFPLDTGKEKFSNGKFPILPDSGKFPSSRQFASKPFPKTHESNVSLSDVCDSKKPPPIILLSDFGIEQDTATIQPVTVHADLQTHLLRCAVVVKKSMLRHIIFRCDPCPTWKTCWHEKIFSDAVFKQHEWATALGLSYSVRWFLNEKQQVNGRGFPVRLFCIDSKPVPFDADVIVSLGKLICTNLNSCNSFQKPSIQVASDFFWLPSDDGVVMADVTSNAECMVLLTKKCGSKGEDLDFYKKHSETIHCYFRTNNLTSEIADAVGAPSNQIKRESNIAVLDVDTNNSEEEEEYN
jgi:hypothetical protein